MPAKKTPDKNADASSLKLPYEDVLARTVDKLTNEFFLFLIGYCVLLIGAEYLTPNLFSHFRWLFYIIPILGMVVYLFVKRGRIRNKIQVDVRSIWADHARVAGITGDASKLEGSVNVVAGMTSEGAEVIGIDQAAGNRQPSDEGYLLDVYRSLDDVGRRAVMKAAVDAASAERPGRRK